MDQKLFSKAIDLKNFRTDSGFWYDEMEMVRREVIPYQWDMLNDRIPEAAKSFCMRNYRIAGRMLREEHENKDYEPPKYSFRGFNALPEDPEHPDDDKFYGFVFQDSDFSKWIEAVAYSLVNHPDKELEQLADEAIDTVCAAQMDNGYLDTYYIINGTDKVFTNTKDHHELYCFGHLTEGAVAYYMATGKDKLLKAAEKYADYVSTVFGLGEGQKNGYPGHEIAEMALVRLFETTGNKKYLDLAKYFVDQRGQRPYYWFGEDNGEKPREGEWFHYYQAHKPVRQQTEAVGHAVRAVYLYSGMTDVARLTGDEELWAACNNLWESAVNRQMYITGGLGSTHIGESFTYSYDLPNDLAYAESCASVGLVFWARRMLETEPDSKYADAMERALYNTVLAGMALDGKSFFYVNPLEVIPEDCKRDPRKQHVKPVRQKWFGCACCPPNIARLVESVPTYAFTETDDTLYIHLYMSGIVRKKVGHNAAIFKLTTDMPWNAHVEIEYLGVEDAEGSFAAADEGDEITMTLAVRIPGWNEGYKRQGTDGLDVRESAGYEYLTGTFRKGMKIVYDFAMSPKVVIADTRVRADAGKVAFVKGPVTYCAEQHDNGADLHLVYADAAAGGLKEGTISICGQTFPTIEAPAVRKHSLLTENGLYREYAPAEEEKCTLTLIPYYAWANRGENEMYVWLKAL